MEANPLSAVRDCLCGNYRPYLEAFSFIRNLKTGHAVVTRDHLCHEKPQQIMIM
jgi:hypothetical protein